jgi:type II secretory pathway pseudopilin PulG
VNIQTPLNKQKGFSYVEVLVASFLLSISLIPALEALQPGIKGSTIHKHYIEDQYQLIAKMEELLITSFSELQTVAIDTANPDIATSYSDTVTFSNGRLISRNVYLSPYDADNADLDDDPFTGTDDDLLWIKVTIEGTPHAVENIVTL